VLFDKFADIFCRNHWFNSNEKNKRTKKQKKEKNYEIFIIDYFKIAMTKIIFFNMLLIQLIE